MPCSHATRAARCLIPLLALTPVSLSAQDVTGGVVGRVVSPVTGPVVGAQITATSPALQGVRVTRSVPDGVFQLLALPPGAYGVRIEAIGHRPLVVQVVRVNLGRTTGLGDVQLEPAAVELGAVTITAPRVTLDVARTTIGATLDTADYAALPAEHRDFRSLISMLPHVNTSYHGDPFFNSGGSTGLENMYFIDGVNVTEALKASYGTTLPYNFVRAVEVKVGGYEAQYGHALGAIVNAVTHSGSNQFEGDVFAFFTNGTLTASSKVPPSVKETGSVSYDVGARLSGPIVRDRLWFSAAYNPRDNRVDREIKPFGTFQDHQHLDVFATKLTWQASSWANVALSFFGDPVIHHEVDVFPGLTPVNVDPALHLAQVGAVTGSVRATVRPSPALLLEASLARSHGRQNILPQTAVGSSEPLFLDFVSGSVEGGAGGFSRVRENRTAAAARATITAGRHTVVAGAEYENVEVSRTVLLDIVFRLDTASFLVDSQGGAGVFHNRVPTAYVQDAWRIGDRLTLSPGLRWSGQWLTGASGETAQRFPNEWQPRFGVSWQLGRRSTQRVFGSYGRFYQQEPLNLSTLWYLDYTGNFKYYSTDPRQPGASPDSVIPNSSYEKDFAHSIDGLEVENFDEFTLGYERLLGAAARVTVRGIRRDLRSSFNWGYYLVPVPGPDTLAWVLGTPGKGNFAFVPPPKRQYTALELSLDGSWRGVQYRASYVLSRTWGNYSGLYASDLGFGNPGATGTLMTPWQAKNSTGLLANDRTHVAKLVLIQHVLPRLLTSAYFTWQSGTPITEFGAGPQGGWPPFPPAFLAPRGSVGRTPAIWDLNLRFAYDAPWPRGTHTRLLLDWLHVGNPREVVGVDQQHFFALAPDGSQTAENQNYLYPTSYQPPRIARLGIDVSF